MNPQAPYGPQLPPAPPPGQPGPQYPAGPPQQPGQNPYDFIMNPDKPPRRSLGPASLPQRLLLIVGSLGLLLIIVFVFMSVFSSGKGTYTDYISAAQTQTELIRVSGAGMTDATSQSVKNAAVTTNLSIKTQQGQLLAFLAARGQEVPAKQLGLKQDAAADQKLSLGKQTSTYDPTFSQVEQAALAAYAAELSQLYAKATSNEARTMLKTHFDQVQLLLEQPAFKAAATP